MIGDPAGSETRNAPNYPDGVAIPEPERQPCLDKEHCDEDQGDAQANSAPSEPINQNTLHPPQSPTEQVENFGLPERPDGPIKPPSK